MRFINTLHVCYKKLNGPFCKIDMSLFQQETVLLRTYQNRRGQGGGVSDAVR